MKVYLTYLGCRLNESEIEEMAWQFAANGHQVVEDPAQAEVCVVNTCTVTHAAGRKSRQVVRRLARANPHAQIAVTGCHATVAPGEVARLPNVAWVVENGAKEGLPGRVAPPLPGGNGSSPATAPRHLGPGRLGRTRAFVKVQDGCDNHCTFCITTVARGAGYSRPADAVVREVQGLVAAGYQEVVLSGVHLGSYDHDRGEREGLYRLVARLLAETAVPRLRLSSLEPWDLSPGFFDLWSDRRMCRQLHLPLQSGSDEILRRMARRTRSADFAALAAEARARIPDLALTTDVIVGFPGEGARQFEESYRFVEATAFSRLHVFTYSARPGTAAARMPGQVSPDEIASRGRALRHLGARQARAFQRRFVGRTLPVLWESPREDGRWAGHTDNYVRVVTTSDRDLSNRILPTRLLRESRHGLVGELEAAG
jgi:threonylcarbamoyladenosine tRNA methylthiotransferase MtaB